MKILFQGDSITDCGRNYEDFHDLGRGYPLLVAARLGKDAPNQHVFLNRGISGNKIEDVYQRRTADIFDLKPDYISLLVGVNDVWHGLAGWGALTSASAFAQKYRMLLEEIKEKLPQTQIALIEPFVLPGEGTNAYFAEFLKLLSERAEIVRMLAEEYHCAYIPMQADFEKMAENMPEGYWLSDGVHPTIYGHQFIADKWIEIFCDPQ